MYLATYLLYIYTKVERKCSNPVTKKLMLKVNFEEVFGRNLCVTPYFCVLFLLWFNGVLFLGFLGEIKQSFTHILSKLFHSITIFTLALKPRQSATKAIIKRREYFMEYKRNIKSGSFLYLTEKEYHEDLHRDNFGERSQ